jgi:hypothetical protein
VNPRLGLGPYAGTTPDGIPALRCRRRTVIWHVGFPADARTEDRISQHDDHVATRWLATRMAVDLEVRRRQGR